ncbi:hypothetical protein [Pseudomonas sp. OHS18]|uniref:hypothetical protein n=1 Tax=Pseudomonas sp. OHS18 TaxID=3399679 RepID=UPI003A86ABFD
MQQDHRLATCSLLPCQPQAGDRQFDTEIRAVARLEAVHIFTQIATQLGTQQRYGKQLTAALHLLRSEPTDCLPQGLPAGRQQKFKIA